MLQLVLLKGKDTEKGSVVACILCSVMINCATCTACTLMACTPHLPDSSLSTEIILVQTSGTFVRRGSVSMVKCLDRTNRQKDVWIVGDF